MMPRPCLLPFVLLCAAQQARSESIQKVCLLQGEQEVPPVATTAEGYGRFLVDTDANTLEYEIGWSELTGAETEAHLYGPAGPGAVGAVLFDLPLGSRKTGTWSYPESAEAALLAGDVYVGVHSTGFPTGELRGQISDLACKANGLMVVPFSTSSTGSAWGVFQIDRDAGTLTYHVVLHSLEGTEIDSQLLLADHAAPGLSFHTLPGGSVKTGVWDYGAILPERLILGGGVYLEVYTTAYPGGEIRGQVTPLLVPLTGDEVVPPAATGAFGYAMFSFTGTHGRLGYYMRIRDLGSAVASQDIHGFAPRGYTAGVLRRLPPDGEFRGAWAYMSPQEAPIQVGLSYVQVTTVGEPAGELRGQIELDYIETPPVGVPSCFGVGCPCGNDDPSSGCMNSTGSGATLEGQGSASLSADDLLLLATSVPENNSGLFYMGSAQVSSPFFDGIQCALGTTWRFLCCTQSSGTGQALFLGPGIAQTSGNLLSAASTWHFHAWYRDVPGSPCGTGANLSNLLSVTFAP